MVNKIFKILYVLMLLGLVLAWFEKKNFRKKQRLIDK